MVVHVHVFKGVAFGELKIPASPQLGKFLNALKLIWTYLLWFGVQEACSVQEMMDQTLRFPISLLVERMDRFALCCWLKILQQVLGAILPVTGFPGYKLLETDMIYDV